MVKVSGFRALILGFVLIIISALVASAAVARPSRETSPKPKSASISENSTTTKKMTRKHRRGSVRSRRHRRYYERFYTSSFANDITAGDTTAGEDPLVRAAAE